MSGLVKLYDEIDARRLSRILGCRSVDLLIEYLRLPLGGKYKDVTTWETCDGDVRIVVGWMKEELFV